jgi:tetratricopeptide (TPR) repeat protein
MGCQWFCRARATLRVPTRKARMVRRVNIWFNEAGERVLARMAQDDAEALSKARDGLEKACRAEAYNKIIKKADEVLKLAPLDGDAIQAKAVALAKKDKCAEALAAAKDGGEALQGLRAYCHYRLGDLDDALECCRSMGEKDEGTCHVEAQVLYKQGDYAGAAGIYEGLLGDGRERGDADRRELEANYYAACCLAKEGARALNTLEPPAQPEEHYELAYNRGCCEAAAGAHATAKASLTAAHAGCERANEDATSSERWDELAPFAAQLAHVEQLLGESDAAAERCKALLKEKPADAAVCCAAANTLVAARGGAAELFDSHKRLRPYASGALPVPPVMEGAFRHNWASVLCAMGKVDDAEKFLAGQDKRAKFPTSKAPFSAVFHSFRLIFGRAIISRNGLEAWMFFS